MWSGQQVVQNDAFLFIEAVRFIGSHVTLTPSNEFWVPYMERPCLAQVHGICNNYTKHGVTELSYLRPEIFGMT